MTKKRITIERTFAAALADVWDLWTTKEGLESWWGPDGFSITVAELDLRVGGLWRYAMTATAPGTIEFMKKAGMPVSTPQKATYTEIAPLARLSYEAVADFIPGVAPYPMATTVELEAKGDRVVMRVLLDPMHDDMWTQRATMGWESQLGKLEKVIGLLH